MYDLYSYSNVIQLLGAIFILLGYYLMASDVKKSALSLTLGCVVWAYWATLISPFPVWLFLLEVTLGGLSLRTWLNK